MSMTQSHLSGTAAASVIVMLLPIMAVVLIAFLIIGLALLVLPLHVHQGLSLGTFAVGLVTGRQFAASLISRVWSGHYSDSRGAKRAVVAGLVMAAGSGLLYLLSLRFIGTPVASATILLLGRALRYCQLGAEGAKLPRAQPSRQSTSAHEGDTGRIAPGGEGVITRSPIVTGGKTVTAELEVVVDRSVNGEKLLGMPD
jgi:MFS family permease